MFPTGHDLTWALVVAVYLVLLGGAVVLLVLAARVLFWLARFLRVATHERELRHELSLVDDAPSSDDARSGGQATSRDAAAGLDAAGPDDDGPEARPAP